MKVKIMEAFAGNADERYNLPDHSFRPGEIAEIDDDLGALWIESGRAAAVEAPPADEEDEEDEEAPEHHQSGIKKVPARHKGRRG